MDHPGQDNLLLRDVALAIPSADKLHPQLRAALPSITSVAADAEALLGIGNVCEGPALAWVKDLVTHHGNGVCSIPYLSPTYCDALLAQFDGECYIPNPEEPPEAQIPEIVLWLRSRPLYDCLAVLWQQAAVPLAKCIWNLDPYAIGSIQVAQYTADDIPGTAMHHDQDSDVTLVVNLGSEFEGGGTEVAAGLFDDAPIVVPPLKKGHAMFFLGKTRMHRGLPVTSGTRTLLVHWSNLS